MIIAVHTPPTTTPRNSTSTRKNNPRGLKFFMRPHLTKPTTTQHNFNPTTYWGGGVTNPPPRVNPSPSFWGQKFVRDNWHHFNTILTLPYSRGEGVTSPPRPPTPELTLTNFFWQKLFEAQTFLEQNIISLTNFFDRIFSTETLF